LISAGSSGIFRASSPLVGGGLIAFSLLGDLHGSETGSVGEDVHSHEGAQLLSLRTLTYFLFGVGATGLLLTWTWEGERSGITAAAALLTGLLCGFVAYVVMAALRRSESGERRRGDEKFLGLPGSVSVPLARGRTGKVVVEQAGRTVELLARPFEADAQDTDTWTRIVVVEMREGVALVSPYDDRALGA
jgi:hypothetical protein